MPKKKAIKTTGYVTSRDKFFEDHKYARLLLGLFIISISIYIGVQLRNIKATQYVILQLLEEGIEPSTVL